MRKRFARPGGFTLVELLVVIAIIGILIGILIPVVSSVRQAAYEASTKQLITTLSSAIEMYQREFRAYPGPIPNEQIRQGGNAGSKIAGASVAIDPSKITMAENLFLGLCGGLENIGGTLTFDVNKATGPRSLGATSKKYPNFMPRESISQGSFVDGNGLAADDTPIPEFVDKFPGELPILYLRARPGASGVATASNVGGNLQQYDLQQVIGYTASNIQVGDTSGDPERAHGLTVIGSATSTPTNGRYALFPYLRDPKLSTSDKHVARRKDTFILISAGRDRIYGTKDDITNFGPVEE